MAASSSWASLALQLVPRAILNPRLAVDLSRLLWYIRRPGWWRHFPFLPLPDREYMGWRMYTAYGDERAVPSAEEVISFARWRRETMHL
jgi:hypothetical protein